jgi:hypothetical protein
MSDGQPYQAAAPERPLSWRIRAWRRARNAVSWEIGSLWRRFGYRPWSRFIHRFGLHVMDANPWIEPGRTLHWCHWCGLRGMTVNMPLTPPSGHIGLSSDRPEAKQ